MNPDRSLRVVLATVGSRGDVQPMLAIAQTLVAQHADTLREMGYRVLVPEERKGRAVA